MNTWFTSDTHWGHKNILKFCPNRPFDTIEEMNESLIERWNDRVKPEDHVYHLGDFSFMKKQETEDILKRLNGNIHLIRGNHDRVFDSDLKRYLTSYQDYKVIPTKRFGVSLVLFHFPIESFDKMHYGAYHFHGHCHSSSGHHPISVIKNRMDVGVDAHPECAPWSFDQIKECLNEPT